MRISDWSSDVCSSDLQGDRVGDLRLQSGIALLERVDDERRIVERGVRDRRALLLRRRIEFDDVGRANVQRTRATEAELAGEIPDQPDLTGAEAPAGHIVGVALGAIEHAPLYQTPVTTQRDVGCNHR